MIDAREYNFVGVEGFHRYLCVLLHTALVETVVNPSLLAPHSPYKVKLSPSGYRNNAFSWCHVYVVLDRSFVDAFLPERSRPTAQHEQDAAKTSPLRGITLTALTIASILVLLILFLFDLSLPNVSADVLVGGTVTKFRLSNLRLSSLNLNWATMLTLHPLHSFNILFRCDLSVSVQGFLLRCTSIKGNLQTGLGDVYHHWLRVITTPTVPAIITEPRNHHKRLSATHTERSALSHWIQALTVHTGKVTLSVDPLHFPASLYLILKDVIAENALCSTSNEAGSSTCTNNTPFGAVTFTKPSVRKQFRAETNRMSAPIPELLLSANKLSITVGHLVPSQVHCLQGRDLQYQRVTCPEHYGQYNSGGSQNKTTVDPVGECMEHVCSVSECVVYSKPAEKDSYNTSAYSAAYSADAHSNSPPRRGCGSQHTPRSTRPQHKELLLSLHHYEATILAMHNRHAKPEVVGVSMKAENIYIRPDTTSNGGGEDKGVSSASTSMAAVESSLALIVYNEFASVFAV